MKKLRSFALYALVTPAITLAAGSVLAEQYPGQDIDGEQQSTQRGQDDKQSTPLSRQNDQGTGQSPSQRAADLEHPALDDRNKSDQSTERTRQTDSRSAAESAQSDKDAKHTPLTKQSDKGTQRVRQSDSHPALDHRNTSNRSAGRGLLVCDNIICL